jgi:hypothetical protein
MTKKHAIGLSKKDKIKVDPTKAAGNLNTITVFAEFAVGAAIKYTYLSSSTHFWDQPTSVAVNAINTVTITAYCLRRRPSSAYVYSYDGDDDLTVTFVYDEGGHEVTDECTFTAVEYDDP